MFRIVCVLVGIATGLKFEINKYRTKNPFRISSNYCHNGLPYYPILAEQIKQINIDLTWFDDVYNLFTVYCILQQLSVEPNRLK